MDEKIRKWLNPRVVDAEKLYDLIYEKVSYDVDAQFLLRWIEKNADLPEEFLDIDELCADQDPEPLFHWSELD